MSKEIVVHLGSVNYACTISDGHHQWVIDEPVENGGNNMSHDPYAALLASLGTCSAITMKMYAQRKGWHVEDIEIKLSLATQIVGGKRNTLFTRNISVKGNLTSEQLIPLEQIVTICPISKILEGEIAIETELAHLPGIYPAGVNDVKQNP